jgi:acyl-coenzyme A thioesterase PaaI-like protein
MDATALARRLLEAVPANRTAGLEVLYAVDGLSRVALTTPPELTNVIGSLHASGFVALLDATGLAAVIAACRTEQEAETLVPLGASATIDFRAPGRGRLVAECTLDDDGRLALDRLLSGDTERARMGTTTEIMDRTGSVVCSGTFRWNIRTYQNA